MDPPVKPEDDKLLLYGQTLLSRIIHEFPYQAEQMLYQSGFTECSTH